jgi:hypothetical protein
VVSISEEPLRPDPRAHLKSQPSLFDQRQVKPSPENRYLRGYTPERMRSVRAATEGSISMPAHGPVPGPAQKVPCQHCGGKGESATWKLHPAADVGALKERGVQINGGMATQPGKCWSCGGKGFQKQTPDTGRGMAATLDHPFYEPHGQRMIQEGIARSTVPTEHLQGLGSIEIPSERKLGTKSMSGTLGLYTKGKVRLYPVPAASPKRGPQAGQRLIEDMGRSSSAFGFARPKRTPDSPKGSPRQRQQAEATLIHEIGHHVSQSSAGPAEEARADKYMTTHWRPDPRDVRQGRDINVQRSTYLHRMGGPYTREQFEQTPSPEPRPKGTRRKRS